jgi:hypothetical protein
MTKDRKEIEKCCGVCSNNLRELLKPLGSALAGYHHLTRIPYLIKLLQLGVVNARRSESKDHLRRQGIGVSANMVDEEIRRL